jgi:hypothetical protein
MHASLEQLIALRDDEPVTLEVQQHVRGCDDCTRALDHLASFRGTLAALPDALPPPDAWVRVVAGLERGGDSARQARWLPAAGLGLVASVVAALVLMNARLAAPLAPDSGSAVTPAVAPVANLPQLMAQSQYLERAVLDLNDSGDRRVVSAGTASAVAELEDRIAFLDYEINQASTQAHSDADLTRLWRQRVDLLQSLAAVRYAQVSDSGI